MTPITLRVKFKVPQDLLRCTGDSGFLHGVQLFTLIVAVFTWGTALSLSHVLHVKNRGTMRSGDAPPIHQLGSEPRPPSGPQLPLQTEASLRQAAATPSVPRWHFSCFSEEPSTAYFLMFVHQCVTLTVGGKVLRKEKKTGA